MHACMHCKSHQENQSSKKLKEKKMSMIITFSVTLVCCLAAGVVEGFTYDDKEVETEDGKSAMFERWRSHHKMEEISEAEKKKQYKTFKSNLEHVHKTNKANKPFKLEMNRFAGMTHEEVRSKYTGLKASALQKIQSLKDPFPPPDQWPWAFRYRNSTIPPAIDWRSRNAVTPAKNQETCGSCYAFAATCAVESIHAIKNNQLVELSPKEIVDCADVGGCGGGTAQHTFIYIAKNGGLTTMKNYPYKPQVEPCNLQKEKDIAVEIHGYEDVIRCHEESLMKAVANQPVCVGIALNQDFSLYKEGVLTSPCDIAVIHEVLAVGYDTAPDGTKYWILKNSWSEEYGDKGYLKMLRGVPEKEGYCGINMWPSYPTIDDDCKDHPADAGPKTQAREL